MNDTSSRPYFLAFAICFILWLLLIGSFKTDDLIAGIIVSGVVSIISAKRLAILNGLIISPLSLISVLRYLWYFLIELIKANFDLAGRILSKNIPLAPAIVEVQTTMRSDLGRLLLANSITLTPGTLSVDIVEDRILVHWIDCPDKLDLEYNTKRIAQGFERHLKGFLK